MNLPLPMPVRRAMKQPGRLMYFGTTDYDRTMFTQDTDQEPFDVCKHVWFGQAPALGSIIRKGEGKKLCESVGPQRIPFEHMWLEGVWDASCGGMDGATSYAVYAHASDAIDPVTRTHLDLETTSYQVFALMEDGFIRRAPMAVTNVVDEQGLVQSTSVNALSTDGGFVHDITKHENGLWAIGMVLPAMWAIGLMNCKNVHLEQSTTEKVTRKQRRRRPGIEYHTIVLPGRRTAKGGGRSSGESHVAQHQVRGHFKTFTAEAPLLGKHTGTYWWGWQVRGSKENGLVISDYKVAEPGHSPLGASA